MLKFFLSRISYILIALLFHSSFIYAFDGQKKVGIVIDKLQYDLESFLGTRENGILLKKGMLKEIAPDFLDLEVEKEGKTYALKEILPENQSVNLFGHHFELFSWCAAWESRYNYLRPNFDPLESIDPYESGSYSIPCLEESLNGYYALNLCLYGKVGLNYSAGNILYEIESKIISQCCLKLTFDQIRDHEIFPFINSAIYDDLSGLKFKWSADLYKKEGDKDDSEF